MKIKGKLVFMGEEAGEMVDSIAKSLAPDNLSGIETVSEKDAVTVSFMADKIGTLLSSVDDYLMNATIVEKLSYSLRQDSRQK
ncbi:Uncharacterised protein [uncultured archaeon]|nr:Uncharacterised protein [uncultured archaeon]